MATITAATHTGANNIVNTLRNNMSNASDNLESLSSGRRKADASSTAIGNKLNGISRVLEQARTNALQGNQVLSVAQGALNEIVNNVNQAKVLAAKSNSGSLDSSARSLVQAEYGKVLTQINTIAAQTRWNGAGLIDGGTRTLTEAGTVANSTSGLTAAPANTFDQTTDAVTGMADGKVQSVTVTGAAGAYNVTMKVTNNAGTMTFSAAAVAEATGATLTLTNSVTGATIAVNFAGTITGITNATTFQTAMETMFGITAGAPINIVSSSAAFANGIATGAFTPGAGTAAGNYHVSHAAGSSNLVLTDGVNTWTQPVVAGAQTVTFANGLQVAIGSGFVLGTANAAMKFTVSTAGSTSLSFQTAEKASDQLAVTFQDATTAGLGLSNTSVDTVANAQTALTALDTAVTTLNSILATVLAQKSQLDSTVSTLETNISNMKAAESSFVDADAAKVMTDYTKWSVLGNFAQAMITNAMGQQKELVQLTRG